MYIAMQLEQGSPVSSLHSQRPLIYYQVRLSDMILFSGLRFAIVLSSLSSYVYAGNYMFHTSCGAGKSMLEIVILKI
jgi:hypothetical protein